MRYSFLGPETKQLNAEGFVNYCDRYGNTIYGVSKDFKPLQKFEGPQMQKAAVGVRCIIERIAHYGRVTGNQIYSVLVYLRQI